MDGGAIFKVSYADGSLTPYTTCAELLRPDGMTFDASGALLYVADVDSWAVTQVTRAGTCSTVVGLGGAPDGIALGKVGTPLEGSLIVNRNDGAISRVDITEDPPVVSLFASGGTRGDFVAVDASGFLYATQTDRVVRIQPAYFALRPGDSPGTSGGPGYGAPPSVGGIAELAPSVPASGSQSASPIRVVGILTTALVTGSAAWYVRQRRRGARH
jgi:hypothetical protein